MESELLIIPGLASPIFKPQNKVYDLLQFEAKKRGINSEIVCMPGQYDNETINNMALDNLAKFTFDAATKTVINRMRNLEDKEIKYTIIARSAGCTIVLNSLFHIHPNYLKNIVFWGITPFAKTYAVFQKETFFEDCKKKGTLTLSIQQNCLPVEYLIENLETNIPIRIGIGEFDEFCSSYYLDYLNKLNKNLFEKYSVKDVGHTVDQTGVKGYDKYINCLFME